MQEQNQKAASGNQNHGVWVCNKCGWRYPNPHPSAKQRRNHKKHCGKIGDSETTGSQKQDRPSSPDSEEDLPVERHGSAVKQRGGALTDEISDKSPHESSIVEDAGAEAGEASSRFEEEVFADAATEFSESLPSPKGGFIQLIDSDQSDDESGSAAGTLRRGHESVAVERGIAASSGEGQMERKPVILSDPVELCRLQTSLHESFETKRREEFVGFSGHPNHGDAEGSTDLRSNEIACILEPDLSKNEAFFGIDNAGSGSVDNMNVNVQDNAMETQNHQILEAEEKLLRGKTQSLDHASSVTKCALEVKGDNIPLLSLSEAPEVQAEHSPDGHLEVVSDETCEKIKGCKKNEVGIESHQKYQSKMNVNKDQYQSTMNVNKDPACHGCQKNGMLYDLDAFDELEASVKDNVVHSESPSSKTCSDTIREFISHSCPPTSRSATDESHATGPFSQVTQGLDKSMPVESEIEKTGHESGKGDGANGYQCHGRSSPLMSTEESPGNFTSISSEIPNPTRVEESERKAECNANLSHENSVFRDKDVPTPLATLNPGKYLEASDVHEDLNLVKQKASLNITGTEAPVQMDGHTQSAVPYSIGTHSASSSPFKESDDLILEQEVKNRDSDDKYGSIILHLQASSVHSDVTIQNESIFIENNTYMEHEEHSPPAALPEDSDFHVHEKLHKESKFDQNCPNEMPKQADLDLSGTVLDNSNDEKSSSAFIWESCDPSIVVHLEDENRAHAVKQLVEVNSSDDFKVELVQSEEIFFASNKDLKTTTVEKSDSLTTTDQTIGMKRFGVSVSVQAYSAVEDDTLRTSENGSQVERKGKKEESSCNDNSKTSAVCEPHENRSDTDVFEPHSLVTLVDPSRDYTKKTIPSDSTAEQVLQNTTTSISDYGGSHFLSTLVNSEELANNETIDKAMSLEKTRTPLKSLLVESMEENTDSKCHKGATMNHPKSPSTTTETLSEVKTPELPSYKVYQSQTKGNHTPTYAAKIRLNSPAWILGNKREKQKSRGVYSWIACVCCSSMN